MTAGMRILMVTHMPWDRNFGGPRVQLELAEELAGMGCTVDKFDVDDAFGTAPLGAYRRRLASNFPARARKFVRAHAQRYDVIDAHQFTLPFDKRELGFAGLLVMRSVGLLPLYLDFARETRGATQARGSFAGNLKVAFDQRRMGAQFERSLDAADLVNVPNDEERDWIRRARPGKPVVTLPFGLSAARRKAFADARAPSEQRLVAPVVACVASWETRKGSGDWPRIVARLRERFPRCRFRFVGTGVGREAVLREFPAAAHEAIEVIPRFRSEELPALLGDATVGAFPSHLDGFGYGVVEMLAAGLPTVTYAIAGPGDIVAVADASWRAAPRDAQAFAARLGDLLALDGAAYAAAAAKGAAAAEVFDTTAIARSTLAAYRAAAEALR